MKTEFLQITTAVDSSETAQKICAALLEARLAACVQISGPAESRYWWKGSLERAREWILTAKTTETLYGRVEAAIQAVHPYETPEITATPLVRGSKEFLAWIADSVEQTP